MRGTVRDADSVTPMPQIHHVSLSNAIGHGQGDVPALLRSLARTIEELGTVTVRDMTSENDVTEDGLWPSATVYVTYGELGEDCRCGSCPADS